MKILLLINDSVLNFIIGVIPIAGFIFFVFIICVVALYYSKKKKTKNSKY